MLSGSSCWRDGTQEDRHLSAARSCSRTMYPSSIRACPLCSGWGAALFVPQVEAPNMELNPFAARRADPFHDKLRLTDQFIAGVTRLTRTGAAPKARNTVLRKSTIGELALDQKTKGGRVHEVPRWWLSAGWCQARFTAVLAQRRQPRRPGCRQRECMADAPGASIGPWSKLRKSPSDTAGQPEIPSKSIPCYGRWWGARNRIKWIRFHPGVICRSLARCFQLPGGHGHAEVVFPLPPGARQSR